MDPDLLRLLLVVMGVLLVLGIYLWDRYQRAAPPLRNRRVTPEPPRPEDRSDRIERVDTGEISARGPGDSPAHDPRAPAFHRPARALDPEPRDLGDWSEDVRRDDPQLSMGLHFNADGDGDYLNADPALAEDVDRKLIVVHLAVRAGMITGPALEKACSAAHLDLGEMSIFHRRDPATGRVLFSLANMVEPGAFPKDAFKDFKTPGLSLFTQLPGARDGLEIYADMLAAANQLAGLLNAEIQDERHNKLTRQMQDHMRESIIEHRRKVRLARSRH